MNRRSNKKYFIILIILLLGITIGYAAINTTLNINGKSNIQKCRSYKIAYYWK